MEIWTNGSTDQFYDLHQGAIVCCCFILQRWRLCSDQQLHCEVASQVPKGNDEPNRNSEQESAKAKEEARKREKGREGREKRCEKERINSISSDSMGSDHFYHTSCPMNFYMCNVFVSEI